MKTLLLSISTKAVARNFAILPGSVLDLLIREKDIRIILLVKKGEGDFYKQRFSADNLIIEEFEENQKKTPLQRVFHFFYSYLIFTKTTQLVSSYGVRADKPRPFWKAYNFPLKWFISHALGSSKWLKKKLVPKLYFRVFNERPYKYLFEKYSPDLIFLPNICIWPCDLEFLAEAKRIQVRTMGMPANWDHLSKYFTPFQVDRLLVWSEPVKKEALQYQEYASQDVTIVGAPIIDFFTKEENVLLRAELLKKIGFPEESKVIMFASQGPYSLDGPDIVEMILGWIEDGTLDKDLRVIIRPHPNAIGEERYDRFKDNPRIYIDRIDSWSTVPNVQNYINVLHHSDVVATTYSTLVTESSLFGTPSIIVNFDGYKKRPMYQSVRRLRDFTHFTCVIATGGVHVVDSADEFRDTIKDYLAHPEHDQKEREHLSTETFGYLDGENTKRLTKEITKYINE